MIDVDGPHQFKKRPYNFFKGDFMENLYCIYMHTSPSGKAYIGQTKNYDKRCREHQYKSSTSILFLKAINKYGFDNFKHEIIENNLTIEEANIFEELYISECKTLSPNGYNLAYGGFNRMQTEETKLKLRIKQNEYIKNNPDIHKLNLEKAREKIMTVEYREARTKIMKYEWATGKRKYTPSNIGRKGKVFLFKNKEGELIEITNMKEFCTENNLTYQKMINVNNGQTSEHMGYKKHSRD